jgi:hypothetical protein
MHRQLRTRPSPPSPRGDKLLEPLLSLYSLAYSVKPSELFPPFFPFVSSGPRHSEAKNNTWFVYRQPNNYITFMTFKKNRLCLLLAPLRALFSKVVCCDELLHGLCAAFMGPIYKVCAYRVANMHKIVWD